MPDEPPTDPTAFQIWAELVVPTFVGIATLVIAIVALVIAVRGHALATRLGEEQIAKADFEERRSISKALELWLKYRRKAEKDDDEFGFVADLLYAKVIRMLARTELPFAKYLGLLISAIDDDPDIESRDPRVLARYDVALALAIDEWGTEPSFMVDNAQTTAWVLRAEDLEDLQVSDAIREAAEIFESLAAD